MLWINFIWIGEGLLIVSAAGASPWTVFAQGIHLNVGLSVGIITILVSVAVLVLWLPLNPKTRYWNNIKRSNYWFDDRYLY